MLGVASLQSLADWQACMWLLMVLYPPIIRGMIMIGVKPALLPCRRLRCSCCSTTMQQSPSTPYNRLDSSMSQQGVKDTEIELKQFV